MHYITDEVREMHPLLKRLLPLLPNITNAEYTHGPHENGADFLLTKIDPTLGHTEYIAVIAKAGGIKRKLRDIKGQIEECWHPRFVAHGKQRVTPTGIWVIFTGYVAALTKTAISQQYHGKNVMFVDGDKLASLLKEYLPQYAPWLPHGPAIYLSDTRRQMHRMTRESDLAGDRTFSYTPDLVEVMPRARQANGGIVDRKRILASSKTVLIEGDAGSGKSTFLRDLVDHLATPEVYTKRPLVPIYITYRDFKDTYRSDLQDLLAAVVADGFAAIRNVRYIVCIDALDEGDVPAGDQQQVVRELACTFAELPRVRGVLTSRFLIGLQDVVHLESVLRCVITPLSPERMATFTGALCTKVSIAQLTEAFKLNRFFRDMPKNPIVAILLARLLEHRDGLRSADGHDDLPSNLTELYAKYVEMMLGRWEIEKGFQSQHDYLALERILQCLAHTMMHKQCEECTFNDVQQQARDYVSKRELGVEADKLLATLKDRCSLVVVDKELKSFRFKHRTFQEFLTACALRNNSDLQLPQDAFALNAMGTYFFYLGLIKDAPVQLRQLVNQVPETAQTTLMKPVLYGNYLLAAYATPRETLVHCLVQMLLEAGTLFNEILSGKRTDVLYEEIRKLGPQVALDVFVRSIHVGYCYGFFAPLLCQAATRIQTLALEGPARDRDAHAFALFLVYSLLLKLERADSFDALLSKERTLCRQQSQKQSGAIHGNLRFAPNQQKDYIGNTTEPEELRANRGCTRIRSRLFPPRLHGDSSTAARCRGAVGAGARCGVLGRWAVRVLLRSWFVG
ncbi:MAG: NACHT domain-containing protein [Acidobacteriota bacterium]